MNGFLHGFAEELVKLGVASNLTGGSGGGARVPKAPNPAGGFAVKKQQMNFSEAPKTKRYREGPKGPNLAPVTTPTTAPKKSGGGKRRKSDGAVLKPSRFLPGERVDDMKAREARTATESAAWKKKKAMGASYNTAYGRSGEQKYTGAGANAPRAKRRADYKVSGMEAPIGGGQKKAPAVKAFKQNIPAPKPVSRTIRMRGTHGFVNVDPSKKAVPKMRNAIDMSTLRPGPKY
jgi:hypothetical protein